MAWLKEPTGTPSPKLASLVERMSSPAGLAAVLQPFTHNANALGAIGALSGALSFGGTTLGRHEEELLSVAVSAWNSCFY